MAKLMFVGAHPDDETFLPGATLAKYASLGHEVYEICATRGEKGMWSDVNPEGRNLGEVRELEHKKAGEILGIREIEYLDYADGYLANKDLDEVVAKLRMITDRIKPDYVVTLDMLGISGHVDHIVMALAASKLFKETDYLMKLYYFVVPKLITEEIYQRTGRTVYGRPENEITTRIDTEKYIAKKIEAAKCHLSQMKDVERLIPGWLTYKQDCFVLGGSRVETKLPETDLLYGYQ